MKVNVDSNTKLLGVVGNPVKHSLSPLFQNYLINKYKLNMVYLPFSVSENSFEDFLMTVKSVENFVGLNITLPFKERAFKLCDELSDEAKKIGAVNTIHFKNGLIYGYNTDVYGVAASIRDSLQIHNLCNKNVLILGAGGAARAVLYACKLLGAKSVILVNRTLVKATTLKEYSERELNLQLITKPFDECNNIISSTELSLIINATSLGLKGDALNINFKKLWKGCKILDIVYSKSKTPLVNDAIKNRFKAIDGLYMLVYQGVKSFTLWTGIETEASKVLKYIKNKVNNAKDTGNRRR